MNMINDGGPAFPVWELNGKDQPEMTGFGMSLRDYIEFHTRPEKPEGEGWRPLVVADTGDGTAPLPRINVKCETVDNGITGATYLKVVRVEQEDDGSLTAVIGQKPETVECAHEALEELSRAPDGNGADHQSKGKQIMDVEREHAEFEAWYRLHHGSRDVYGRDTSGEYIDKWVQGAFNVWQARAALAAQDEALLRQALERGA